MPRWCKTLLLNALALLLPEPLARHDGPSTVRLSLTEQAGHDRWIVHLLHYIPERRGEDFDVIEDVIPLHDSPSRSCCRGLLQGSERYRRARI